MDTVNTPVQKKSFPIAAIGFTLCLPVLLTRAFLPIISRFFGLPYTADPVEMFTLFCASAALICLVIGLFLRKTNLLVSIPLCVMSGVYAVHTLSAVINWIKQITYFRDDGMLNTEVIVSNNINYLVLIAANIFALLGFLLFAVVAFGANKNSLSLVKLWWIPFVSFTVFAFFSVVRVFAALASVIRLIASLSFDHTGHTLVLYSQIYSFVYLLLTAALAVLFAISGFFLGRYLARSVKA